MKTSGVMIAAITILAAGCATHEERDTTDISHMTIPVVLRVRDSSGAAIPNADAIPDIVWTGPPCMADTNGVIRINAWRNRGIRLTVQDRQHILIPYEAFSARSEYVFTLPVELRTDEELPNQGIQRTR
jgi:hypothetical protein